MPAWISASAKELQKTYPNVKVVGDEITTSSESEYYSKLDLTERSAVDRTRRRLRGLLPDRVRCQRRVPPSAAPATELVRMEELLPRDEEQRHVRRQGLRRDEQHRRAAGVLQPQALQAGRSACDLAATQLGRRPVRGQGHPRHDSGVVPLWVYTGQAVGEASSFRGFEVFLNGTKDRLYDYTTHKWEVSGPGFDADLEAAGADAAGRGAGVHVVESPRRRHGGPPADPPPTGRHRLRRQLGPHGLRPRWTGTVVRVLQRVRGGGHPDADRRRSRIHEPVGRLGALGAEPGLPPRASPRPSSKPPRRPRSWPRSTPRRAICRRGPTSSPSRPGRPR